MIFISYSTLDAAIAREVATHVQSRGLPVFIDYQRFAGGDEFIEVIGKEIAKSDAVLLLLSANATNSKWVRWELAWALRLEKHIIPLMLEAVSYESIFPIVTLHHVDFRGVRSATSGQCFSDLDAALGLARSTASVVTERPAPLPTDDKSAQRAESDTRMSERQLHDILVNALRVRDAQPETAIYLGRTILQQSPDYLADWLADFVRMLEAQLRTDRIRALEQRLEDAIRSSDESTAELTARDIAHLDATHRRASGFLEGLARRRKSDRLYEAAAKTIGVDIDVTLSLLKEVRQLEPDYGDPAGLLAGQPITAQSAGLIRQLTELAPKLADAHPRCHFAFAPRSNLVAVSTFYFQNQLHSDKIAVYEVRDGGTLRILDPAPDPRGPRWSWWIKKLAFAGNGRFLAAGSDHGAVVVWDMEGFDLVAKVAPDAYLLALALSSSGAVLATVTAPYEPRGSGAPARVSLWQLPSGERVSMLPPEEEEVDARKVGFTWHTRQGSLSVLEGQSLVGSAWFDRVRVWNYMTGEVAAEIKYSNPKVVAISPDGIRIAIASSYAADLFEIGMSADSEHPQPPPSVVVRPDPDARRPPISCLTFNPGGDVLVVAREAEDVELWDTNRGISLIRLHPKAIDVESVVFSEDGRRLYVKDAVYGLG